MNRDLNNSIDLINLENYQLVQNIGMRTFSFLYVVKQRDSNKDYVFRTISKKGSNLSNFFRVVESIQMINITCLNKIYSYHYIPFNIEFPPDLNINFPDETRHSKRFLLIANHEKYTDLESLINQYLTLKGEKPAILNPTIRSKIIFGTACALKYLHKHNIVHCNFKPSHVLLDSNLEPKVTFSGLTQYLPDNEIFKTVCGTYIYMAPEVMNNNNNKGYPADVYAFAVFLYRFFSENFIFKRNEEKITILKFIKHITRGERYKRPDYVPDCYWNLIESCWSQDPSERPTFDEITKILKDDKFALDEFGMKTDLNELHEYQMRADESDLDSTESFAFFRKSLMIENK